MKKSIVCLVCALSISTAIAETVCRPGDGPYVSMGIGISKFQKWNNGTHFKTNPAFRFAIGSQFSVFRAEFEPSYARAKFTAGSNSGHVNILSTLGNLYWGLPFEGNFSSYPIAPYLGAGVGFSSVRANFSPLQVQNQGHSTILSYQGIAGVRLALNEQLGLNVEYRYFSTEKLNYIGKRIAAHAANLGLTYRF